MLALGPGGTAFAAQDEAAMFKPAAAEEDLTGKTVVLHSNDVHGAVDGYAKMAALRLAYEAKGAAVLTVDAGDFSQGDPYVNLSQGADGLKLGFFGLITPETATKSLPTQTTGITFLTGAELARCAQEQIDALRAEGAEAVIALTHLGVDKESQREANSSLNVYAGVTGLDFVIDGHSHSVMTRGEGGEPIQSGSARRM